MSARPSVRAAVGTPADCGEHGAKAERFVGGYASFGIAWDSASILGGLDTQGFVGLVGEIRGVE